MHLGYYNLYSFDFTGQTLCKSLTVLGVSWRPRVAHSPVLRGSHYLGVGLQICML